MRRVIPLIFVVAAGLLPAGASAGPTISAADLAEDCNKDGLVLVENQLRVDGGSGTLLRDCFISMAPKATLELRDVRSTAATSPS